jgi:RNA polymerase sigma factor (sigma-70 family)
MQTCVSKIGLLPARAAADISIDSLPEIERHSPARTSRCLLHIVATLRRPRTVRFHWAEILRDLRGVETQSSRPAPRSARSAPTELRKNAMATALKAKYPSRSEDCRSSEKIVNFSVVKKPEEPGMSQEYELASFEAMMLPHLDAAHNLARWLLRNEEDAQDVVQEAYLRAFKSFHGFHGSEGRAWLLTIVRNTAYTWLRKNRAVDLATFDEEIHTPGSEAANPAAMLEQTEDAEAIREAMEDLAVEFREILVLRHLEGLS